MLAPGDGSDHVQFIDASDVARFAVSVTENALSGGFNLAGPRLTWAEFMALLGARNVVWVPATIIRSQGVTEFELPLYRPAGGRRSSLMHVSNERAVGAGLTLSDPGTTVNAVRAWRRGRNIAPALSPERESALIRVSSQSC
jgi:2'-hydroxyisoflavone reductase